MVPAFAREQIGFEVERVASEERDSNERTLSAVAAAFTDDRAIHGRATCGALARLEANARRPNIAGDGRMGTIVLDVSSHSRRSKAGLGAIGPRHNGPYAFESCRIALVTVWIVPRDRAADHTEALEVIPAIRVRGLGTTALRHEERGASTPW